MDSYLLVLDDDTFRSLCLGMFGFGLEKTIAAIRQNNLPTQIILCLCNQRLHRQWPPTFATSSVTAHATTLLTIRSGLGRLRGGLRGR